MTAHDCNGCAEYRDLSRRRFMAASGATLAALSAPAWLPRVALAKSYRSSQRDVVIVIYLRGAADGLSMVTPFTDNNYYTARPNLGIPRPDSGLSNRLLTLGGGDTVPGPGASSTTFAINPNLAPLLPAYQANHLLFVQACGSTDPSRSHFDAQRFMEVGKANDITLSTGWLGRHLQSVTPMNGAALLRGVGINTGLQRSLVGGPLTLPIPDLDNFGISGNSGTLTARTGVLHDMYNLTAEPLHSVGLNTVSTIDLLNTINFATYTPAGGAAYPTGSFGYAMKTTAALVKAQVGVEAVAIDVGGWDTHANQGVTTGTMASLMTTLSQALAAFHTDVIASGGPSVCVVTMSEFGRRLVENASIGTDHGHANTMMVMGQCVAGGRVLTDQWPGLATSALFQGLDLQVTIDYRDVLTEIVRSRLGNQNIASVFPSFTPRTTPLGVISC